MKKGKFIFKINKDWCKGCSICVEFCPKKVLVLEDDKAVYKYPEECIGCRLCCMRCPDLAIEIFEKVDAA